MAALLIQLSIEIPQIWLSGELKMEGEDLEKISLLRQEFFDAMPFNSDRRIKGKYSGSKSSLKSRVVRGLPGLEVIEEGTNIREEIRAMIDGIVIPDFVKDGGSFVARLIYEQENLGIPLEKLLEEAAVYEFSDREGWKAKQRVVVSLLD